MTKPHRQSGASLLIALIMLIVVMLLGVSAARMALMNEKSSRSDRDRQIAFEAAEAALRDAELDIFGDAANARGQIEAFPELPGSCHESGAFAGLCSTGDTPLWTIFNMRAPTPWIEYGRYSGQRFPYGTASLASRPPRYLVELIAVGKPGAGASALRRYRVTAVGFGTRESTQVVLQSIHAINAAPDQANKPPVRLGWREIGNWKENSH
ncbi:Tfp pilus assembly protein PilX [Herbaspirillum sp. CF444]|uniref:pilus assembly PilX family protein n=1 Tax=Herbaspirillum sp. CF444 TaxID=1144319 RepID=UPI0002724BA5|nr:PilX N-terminal domain-containing pilus assembly protein [Herbaspirillum sp. CF444]EJL91884.1 Tfp pilus assembly protein PilX [Herbaspirillum sp. CF444]